MEASYRFFTNTACQYFPCHKSPSAEKFNCLFCFCPLYFLEECGGNFKLHKHIKDCSDCSIPHTIEGYDFIIKKIKCALEEK